MGEGFTSIDGSNHPGFLCLVCVLCGQAKNPRGTTTEDTEGTEARPCHHLAREPMLHCSQGDRSIFIVGSVLGICAGWLDLKVGDLLFTALFVLASTMLLGAVRPQRPWRWTLLVAVFVPIVQLLAYLFMTQKPYRAQIYESFLGFLTGIAGAYGGSVGRSMVNNILGEK